MRSERERSGGDLVWILGLFALSLGLLLPGANFGLPGGKSLNGAAIVLEGGVPYRDFWTMYAPGPTWLTAATFALFGKLVLVQGLVAVAITAFGACAFFALLRALGTGRPFALALGLLFTATFWTTAPEIKTYLPALLLILLALRCFVRFLQRGGGRRLVVAGALYGLAAAFKHDVAAYAAVATTLALLLRASARRADDEPPRAEPSRVRAVLLLAGGCLLTFVPWAGYLGVRAGRDALEDLILFPLGDFRVVRTEPYPAWRATRPDDWVLELGERFATAGDAALELATRAPTGDALRRAVGTLSAERDWLLGKLPELFFPLAAMGLALAWRASAPWKRTAALAFLLAMPAYWNAAHVQQNTHFFTLPLLAYLLVALAWPACGAWRRAALLVPLALFALASLIAPAIQVGRLLREWPTHRELGTPVMRGMRVAESDYELFEPIVAFLRANLREDERFYCGLGRHDSIVINDLRFHYLADRRSATRHHELHPGIADREETQREIAADLERHDVRAVVLWDFGWSKAFLDELLAKARERIPELGSTFLDEWIAERYATIGRFGEYRVLWRRDLPMPAVPLQH